MNKRYIKVGVCGHCQEKRGIIARGLCSTCYHKNGVREKFPVAYVVRQWTALEVRRLGEMFAKNWLIRRIARILGRTYASVHNQLRRMGRKLYERRPESRARKLAKWYDPDKHTDWDAAEYLGISPSGATQVRKRAGLPKTRVNFRSAEYRKKRLTRAVNRAKNAMVKKKENARAQVQHAEA